MRTRSWLIASSLNPKLMAKSHLVSADVALFDLEDSVATAEKEAARAALAERLCQSPEVATAVRVNTLTSLEGVKDLLFLVSHDVAPDIVILPKITVPDDFTLATRVLLERHPHVRLFAIVETVASLCSLRELRAPPRGLCGLHFGAADLAADLGIDLEDADWSNVRYEIGLIARRLGVSAIDTPCFQYRDHDPLRRELAEAKRFGFTGKIAIHPSQVSIINQFFTPSPREVESAERLVRAHEQGGDGAIFTIDGQMAGPPFLKQALHVMERVSTEQGDAPRRKRNDK